MLIIADANYNQLGVLPYAQDIKRTRDITGVDTLEFNYSMFVVSNGNEVEDDMLDTIKAQNHILTADQIYVIKEVNPSDDNILEVECEVDTEDLKSLYNNAFVRTNVAITEIAHNALIGSDWVVNTDVTKLRSLSMTNSTALDILKKLAETYMCDLQFDAKNKIVHFYTKMGTSNGVFFNDKLNLVSLNVKQDTHDFCTRLIPVGQDSLYITDVNGGLPYVENYQYTDQIITAYWDAGQYTDKNALKEDAIEKLKLLSMPKVTFDAKVADLARISELNPEIGDYDNLAYSIGDTVTIMDTKKNLGQPARVIQTVEYMDSPEQNTVQFDSMYQVMEDLFEKSLHTTDTVDAITTPDGGSVSGDAVDKIDWTKVQNVQVVNAQIGDAEITTAKIGQAQITTALIQDATITTAKIGDLQVTNEKVVSLSASKINTGTLDASKITVIHMDAGSIDVGTLSGSLVNITNLNADNIIFGTLDGRKAKIIHLDADEIDSGTINANLISVINLSASNINTGYLNADRIYTGTLTGDKLVAGTITATQIAANTITAKEIDSHTITANEIATDTITAESGIISAAAIGTAQIQDAAITGAKIGLATIGTVNIENGAITTALIGTGAIQTEQVADGSITDAKIVNLTASKITAGTLDAGVINVVNLNADNITTGTINGQRITDNTIGGSKIQDDTIDNSKIQDGASINGTKLDIATVFDAMNNSAELDLYGSGGYGEITYGGRNVALHDDKVLVVQDGKSLDLVLSNVGDRLDFAELKIQPDSIISTVISSDEFTEKSSQIAQTAENIKIGFNGIDDNVVFDENGLHVNHGSIDASLANITNINASNISTGMISGNFITANTITTDKLVAQAITADKIASHTITANEIVANTITSAEIKTGSIIADDLQANTITSSSACIASLNASKITTGTLDANLVNVIHLNASNITAGTISGDRIYGGTISGVTLEGVTVKTTDTTDWVELSDQDLLFYKNGQVLMKLSHSSAFGTPYIEMGVGGARKTMAEMRMDASALILHADLITPPTDTDGNRGNSVSIGGLEAMGILNVVSNYSGTSTGNGDIFAEGVIHANSTISADGGFYKLGHVPGYQQTISISSGTSVNIYHGLGYAPIITWDGTVGNVIITTNNLSNYQTRVYCYSGGGATWNGTVYFW